MLKFLIDKLRDHTGPLKEARLVVGDVAEEFVDLVGHYISKLRKSPKSEEEEAPPQAPASPPPESPESSPSAKEEPKPSAPKSKTKSKATKSTKSTPKSKKASTKTKKKNQPAAKELPRTIDVPVELAAALDVPANRRKQDFKVLSILWDVRQRNMGGMTAKALSEHGEKLGLAIRHENIRKVVKMRLEAYVEALQEQNERVTVFHYRLKDEGVTYFTKTYLK